MFYQNVGYRNKRNGIFTPSMKRPGYFDSYSKDKGNNYDDFREKYNKLFENQANMLKKSNHTKKIK